MKNRVVNMIIALEFLAMLLIPLLTFNREPGIISVAENRTLASFPTLLDVDGRLSKTLSKDLVAWFNDNIGLREYLIRLNSVIRFNLFHQPTSTNVELGRDGWLFYTLESNLDIARGTYPDFEEEKLETYCNQLIRVEKKLHDQGRDFVLVIPASKASIYPEYIQSGDYGIRETPADTFADYLESHSDIKVVRLKDAMLEAKSESDELLYFKTDTHWNFYGRYLGYRKIVEDLNRWGIIDSKPLEVRYLPAAPYSGDLARMMGAVDFAGNRCSETVALVAELKDPCVEKVESGEQYDFYTDQIGLQRGSMWRNDALTDGKRLVVFGDSMIGGCNISYIAEHFSETTFVWSYFIEQRRLDYLEPDVVILDISERCLSRELPDMFDSFLKTNCVYDPITDTLDITYYDDGEFDSMQFPTWSQEDDQDDLVWYQAERVGTDRWHVQVDLKQHHSRGNFLIHFYHNEEFVSWLSYYVGTPN